MANRPYLTSAEAATYCGFKTIGGIQQAVRRGKLKPAGRRGGTGTYVFATADLDAFLTGGLKPHERLFVPLDSPASPDSLSFPNFPKSIGAAPSPPPGDAKATSPAAQRPAKRPEKARRSPNHSPDHQPDHLPDDLPAHLPAHSPAHPPKLAPKRGPKSAEKDDPVARIVRALSFAPAKAEKAGKRRAAR